MVYFIGYKCPWEKFPTMKFLDGDPTKLEFSENIGPITTPLISAQDKAVAGFRIKRTNVPTKLLWSSRHGMPDFEGPPGFVCVSPRMKDVIEHFEPDVHQFFPVTVVNKRREQIAKHWLWVVCNRIDSVDREHTTLVLYKETMWLARYPDEAKEIEVPNPKVVFSKAQTKGYHFWRDKFLRGGGIYVSDDAGVALQAAKFTALRVTHQETV